MNSLGKQKCLDNMPKGKEKQKQKMNLKDDAG